MCLYTLLCCITSLKWRKLQEHFFNTISFNIAGTDAHEFFIVGTYFVNYQSIQFGRANFCEYGFQEHVFTNDLYQLFLDLLSEHCDLVLGDSF